VNPERVKTERSESEKIMDEIDRAKIGKKDEKLVGWDYLRKPKQPATNLPPMKAKNALLTPNAIRVMPSSKNKQSNNGSGFFWFIVILGAIGIIIAKLLGFW
jgi:hypothetical protein